jgi:hypothetical protein
MASKKIVSTGLSVPTDGDRKILSQIIVLKILKNILEDDN